MSEAQKKSEVVDKPVVQLVINGEVASTARVQRSQKDNGWVARIQISTKDKDGQWLNAAMPVNTSNDSAIAELFCFVNDQS